MSYQINPFTGQFDTVSDLSGYLTSIIGQDLSTADNTTSAFITLSDIPTVDLSSYLFKPVVSIKTADYVTTGAETNNTVFVFQTFTAGTRFTVDPSDFTSGTILSVVHKGVDGEILYVDAGTGNTMNGGQVYELNHSGNAIIFVWKSSTAWEILSEASPYYDKVYGLTLFVEVTVENTVQDLALQKSNNLNDLLDVPGARTNLGLGTMSVQNASSVAITAGTIAGLTQLNLASTALTTSTIGNIEFYGDDYYANITTPINGSQYPYAYSTTYVRATTIFSTGYYAHFATNPSLSLIGGFSSVAWVSGSGNTTNQRFHIDLGEKKVIDKIYYENLHNSGSNTTNGVENFTFWGTNDATSFAETTYGTDTGWTQITTSQATFDIHVASNTTDPKYITATNTTGYRYYAFKFADNYGGAAYMGVRRIELQVTNNYRKNLVMTDGSALTATYLPYASTNGRLKDTNVFYDSTNARLGLGITTPISTLDVNGTTDLRSKVTLGRNLTGSGWQTAMDVLLSSALRPVLAVNLTTGKLGYIAEGGTQGLTLMTDGRSVLLDARSTAGTGAFVTASASEDQTNAHLDMVGTWNNAAQKYWGLRMDYTDTASLSTSLLMDLQVSNASKFSVRKDGLMTTVSDSIIITTSKTPASASATGTTGQIAWDASYLYVCTATNTWNRSAIATW